MWQGCYITELDCDEKKLKIIQIQYNDSKCTGRQLKNTYYLIGAWNMNSLHGEIMIEIYCYCSWDFYILVSITSLKFFIQNKYIYEYTENKL